MDYFKVASEIAEYLASNRGVGHTKTLLKGMEATPEARMIVVNKCTEPEINYRNKISLNSIESYSLRGFRFPIVIDNSALKHLLFGMLNQRNAEMNNPVQDGSLLSYLPAVFKDITAQLTADNKRWGDTWKYRPREGQEERTFNRYLDYLDQYRNAGTPIPWLKVIGEAIICMVREANPDDY
jgi:hypothetical protein